MSNASDPRKATKIDENELLRLKNIDLQIQLLTGERETLHRSIAAKYAGGSDMVLQVTADGNIVRPLASVPAGKGAGGKGAK